MGWIQNTMQSLSVLI